MEANWLETLGLVALVSVHLFAGKLRFLDVIPRSRWLSFAGGISVAYVFIHIFPELAAAQSRIDSELNPGESWLKHHAYLVALIGLTLFYGLERLVLAHSARKREDRNSESREETEASPGSFWSHIALFALYNAVIGLLLTHRGGTGSGGQLTFALAMSVHFLVNDFGLRQHHKRTYHRIGRWVLASSVLLGWTVARLFPPGELAVATLFAFLAGAILLNVLKEELPEERQSRFLPFLAGVVAYSGLLVFIG